MQRFVDVDGLFNIRDIGGYPAAGGTTRWGVLFRGSRFDLLSDLAQSQVAALGLRTVIDLREDKELLTEPTGGLDAETVSHLVPIYRGRLSFEGFDDLEHLYDVVLELAAPEFVEILEHLAAPDALPALVHCTAGKDRTGLAIGLLLCLLGVDDETVVADYGLTETSYTPELREKWSARAAAVGVDAQRLALMIGSPPDLFLRVLATLRQKYGTVEEYLLAHGLRPATVDALRAALVEPSGA